LEKKCGKIYYWKKKFGKIKIFGKIYYCEKNILLKIYYWKKIWEKCITGINIASNGTCWWKVPLLHL